MGNKKRASNKRLGLTPTINTFHSPTQSSTSSSLTLNTNVLSSQNHSTSPNLLHHLPKLDTSSPTSLLHPPNVIPITNETITAPIEQKNTSSELDDKDIPVQIVNNRTPSQINHENKENTNTNKFDIKSNENQNQAHHPSMNSIDMDSINHINHKVSRISQHFSSPFNQTFNPTSTSTNSETTSPSSSFDTTFNNTILPQKPSLISVEPNGTHSTASKPPQTRVVIQNIALSPQHGQTLPIPIAQSLRLSSPLHTSPTHISFAHHHHHHHQHHQQQKQQQQQSSIQSLSPDLSHPHCDSSQFPSLSNSSPIPTSLPEDLPTTTHVQAHVHLTTDFLASPQHNQSASTISHAFPNEKTILGMHKNMNSMSGVSTNNVAENGTKNNSIINSSSIVPILSTSGSLSIKSGYQNNKNDTNDKNGKINNPQPPSTASTAPTASTSSTTSTVSVSAAIATNTTTSTTPHPIIKQVSASTLVNHTYRLIVLGSEGCGKTSLLRRFASNSFSPQYLPTIGIDYLSSIFTSGSTNVYTKLHIWDSSGNQRFSSLIPSYLRDSAVCLCCFDLTNIDSYNALFDLYLPSIRNNYGDNIIIIAVGCKSDLQRQRVVSYNDIKEKTKTLAIPYLETSSKTGSNVAILFSQIAQILPEIASEQQTLQGPGGDNGTPHQIGDDQMMSRKGMNNHNNDTLHTDDDMPSAGLCSSFWRCW